MFPRLGTFLLQFIKLNSDPLWKYPHSDPVSSSTTRCLIHVSDWSNSHIHSSHTGRSLQSDRMQVSLPVTNSCHGNIACYRQHYCSPISYSLSWRTAMQSSTIFKCQWKLSATCTLLCLFSENLRKSPMSSFLVALATCPVVKRYLPEDCVNRLN